MSTAIAVDIDGVLANFIKGFTELCHELDSRMPILEGHHECPEWKMQGWYAPAVERKTVSAVIEKAWDKVHRTSFWRQLEPLVAMPRLNQWAREQPLVFMTRRDGFEAWNQTRSWLGGVYGVEDPLLIRIKSGEEKSDWCNRLGIKVLIDDSPTYGQDFCDNVEDGVLLQPCYPYNIQRVLGKHVIAYPYHNLKAALAEGAKWVSQR